MRKSRVRTVLACWVVRAGLLGMLSCDGSQAKPVDPCITAYPRGQMAQVASLDAVRQAVNECRGDDGPCQASTACQGKPSDRQCEPTEFITADAALCVAQATGLDTGLERLRTGLVYNYAFRRVTWNVSNVVYDGTRGSRPDAGGGARGGQAIAVDATDARVLARYEWAGDR